MQLIDKKDWSSRRRRIDMTYSSKSNWSSHSRRIDMFSSAQLRRTHNVQHVDIKFHRGYVHRSSLSMHNGCICIHVKR